MARGGRGLKPGKNITLMFDLIKYSRDGPEDGKMLELMCVYVVIVKIKRQPLLRL